MNAMSGPLEASAITLGNRAALIVVDAQQGFDDPTWGPRNNPAADAHIAALVETVAATDHALVYIRHDGLAPSGRLHPSNPGNRFKSYLSYEPDLVVSKHVNSAFHGTPDLDGWLTAAGIDAVVICGITTNHCCETTARVAGNLGYRTYFVLDATYTFDRVAPDGSLMTADELARATATNLHNEFATVVSTQAVLDALGHKS